MDSWIGNLVTVIVIGGLTGQRAFRLKKLGMLDRAVILRTAPLIPLAVFVFLAVVPGLSLLIVGYHRTCEFGILKGCLNEFGGWWGLASGVLLNACLPTLLISLAGCLIGVFGAKTS